MSTGELASITANSSEKICISSSILHRRMTQSLFCKSMTLFVHITISFHLKADTVEQKQLPCSDLLFWLNTYRTALITPGIQCITPRFKMEQYYVGIHDENCPSYSEHEHYLGKFSITDCVCFVHWQAYTLTYLKQLYVAYRLPITACLA